MAPSSLRGHAGLGIYTTRDIAADESILNAPDGPSIPVVDTERVSPEYRHVRRAFHRVFDEYWWGRGVPDHVAHEAEGDVIDYQITFGALPNHHCLLSTIDLRYPAAASYQDDLLDRFESPGAGAISPAPGRDFFVGRPVRAGEELFLNYGHCRRDPHRDRDRSHGWTTDIAMPVDVAEAAALIQKAWRTRRRREDSPKHEQEEESSSQPVDYPVSGKQPNEFVRALLPKTTRELLQLMRHAPDDVDAMSAKDWQRHVARYQGTTARTPEWIRSHGMCLEHLVPAPSRMPHAGRGGMAQHRIGRGELVVPAPLLHILDRRVLRIDYDPEDPHESSRNPVQLLLNYCLGHPETPLLLCPNTNAILLNHCSTRHAQFRKHCPQGPNAAFRWASGWDAHSATWQRMTLDELAQRGDRGLAMEVVASRPIAPGEEVFVDYGVEWERAWWRHVETWKAPSLPANTTTPWITAAEANRDDRAAILSAFVAGDLRRTVDHRHLFTGCQYWTTEWEDDRVFAKPNPGWTALSDEELLERYADDGREYEGSYLQHDDMVHWPCSVLRDNGDNTYTVRIHQSSWYDDTSWHVNEVPRLLTRYPRSSIHYFVKPYHGDQHLPTAFRHPIGIPDKIMPPQWKTLTKNKKTS